MPTIHLTPAEVAALERRPGVVVRRTPELVPAKPSAQSHTPGVMNKTEAAFAAYLDSEKSLGMIVTYWFEAFKLRLAERCWYTPDFLVMTAPGVFEFMEVKGGFVRDDSLVKIKMAAELYPQFKFTMVKKQKGDWDSKTFLSRRR